MKVMLTDRYSEIAEAPKGTLCVYCGSGDQSSNPVLVFSALSKPTVTVHGHCYIHWAYQQAQQPVDAT